MHISSAYRLSSGQKWKLANGIVFIYLPVRIFINNPSLDQHIFFAKAPLWAVELIINIIFFVLWINVIEFIQLFFEWLDERVKLRLPSRLITFFVGIALAILFNFAFLMIWLKMEGIVRNKFHINIYKTVPIEKVIRRSEKARFNTGLTVIAMLAAIYMVLERRSNNRLELIRLNAERLQKENVQTQFIALKNQLSPHFLFNSFSILSSLIEKDPAKSVIYVSRLARSYRYILEQSGLESIRLKTELDFIENYTFLLKSRFDEKLSVEIDVPSASREQYKIAPLTLQLLIENAVKHNQMSAEKPLIISIRTEWMYLVVSNPLKIRPGEAGSTGLGLMNIVNRYKLLTKEPVFVIEDGGEFTVKIPLLT
jgi:two-component system LytT family sensor kinase